MRKSIGGIIVFLLLSPWLFAEESKLKIIDGEKFNGVLTSEKGEIEKAQITFYVTEGDGKTMYSYVYILPKVTWYVKTDVHAYPIKIVYEEAGNRMEFHFSGKGGVEMKGLWKGKKVTKTGKCAEWLQLRGRKYRKQSSINFEVTKKYCDKHSCLWFTLKEAQANNTMIFFTC